MRKQEMDKASDKSRKDLANAEADFNIVLAKNRLQWAKEEEEHNNRVKEIEKELFDLETRKRNALAPIEFIKKQEAEKLQTTTEYLAVLVKRDEETEKLNEALQDKLDKIGQQEQDLIKDRQQFELKKQGIEQQQETTIQGSRQLSEKIAGFNLNKQEVEADLNKRKFDIGLMEAGLVSKEATLKYSQEELNKKIADTEILLETLAKEKQETQSALLIGIQVNDECKKKLEQQKSEFIEYRKIEEEKLDNRKTAVTLIESSLIAKEAKLKRKQIEIENSLAEIQSEKEKLKQAQLRNEEMKSNTSIELQKEKEDFAVYKSKIEKIVEDKAMINSAESEKLANKEQELKKQEKFLAEWSAKLTDERGSLQRNWDELKHK